MPNNVNRNKIERVAINKKDLTRANKYLAATGYRLCPYSGQLFTLNAKNFHAMASDDSGFQPVSKIGKMLYNNDSLDAVIETQPYERNVGGTTELI